MKKHSSLHALAACALTLLIAITISANGATQSKTKSLYERVGGYNALAAVVDDFIGWLVADDRFTKFFAGHSDDSKQRIRQHILDQFCVATGGPCIYTGRDMKTSHKGLGITEADWDEGAKRLVASLDKFKVPEKEKGELVAFVTSLKKDMWKSSFQTNDPQREVVGSETSHRFARINTDRILICVIRANLWLFICLVCGFLTGLLLPTQAAGFEFFPLFLLLVVELTGQGINGNVVR